MFNFNLDRKKILILIIIIALLGIGNLDITSLLLSLPGVLIAITFHEFGHAWMTVHFGDNTPRRQGRLTLNPFAHMEPLGMVLLIFAHIGWGRPVEFNPNNWTTDKPKGYCEAMIALAGPAMNFILAIVFTIIYYLVVILFPSFAMTQMGVLIIGLIVATIQINVGLGVFNLIPLPPLDGEKIFRNLLPSKASAWLIENNDLLQTIFLVLWITGGLSKVVSPVIVGISNGIFFVVSKIFGLFL